MLFEVVGIDKKVKGYTHQRSCIPPAETLRSMQAAGYIFRLDGNLYTPAKHRSRKVDTDE